MKKIYHLGTCNTCQRILKALQPLTGVELQEIKTSPITLEQLEEMHALAGSYEALFSRKAQLYRKRGLHESVLVESDYKKLLLEHYTFLKRPVVIIDQQIFIGNAKKEVEAAFKALHS
mgnify:CR=1 FL=1|tara:strand:- start:1089 stop:1442 length:354 start_codon:yes stop_codon:yes gene_type:complete